MNRNLFIASILSLAAAGAFAQTNAASSVQRDQNQQQRIENGLQNGTITTREAGELERDEHKVDKLQAKEMKDGTLSPADKARLNAAQDKASRDIHTATHNGVNGNPMSASSQRMQADVQRNVNQEKRVEQGVQNGTLTNREVAKLEHGQAKVDGKEAKAAHNGHVGKAEQKGIQHAENHQSNEVNKEKHDGQNRG